MNRLAFSLAALVASSAVAQTFSCPTSVRFHFVGVHKDDGSLGPGFDPANLTAFVNVANTAFGSAGLTFNYRQSLDWEDMNSTLLWEGLKFYCEYPGGCGAQQISAGDLANSIAAAHPGKIVVFFRGDSPPSGDWASPRLLAAKPVNTGWDNGRDFISYWGFSEHPNPDLNAEAGVFAHELGHYLGLYHTQPNVGGMSTATAKARLESAFNECSNDGECTITGTRCVDGYCRLNMDGDPNVNDSPADPSPSSSLTVATDIFCTTAADCGTTTLGETTACLSSKCSYTYNPPLNVMSYRGGLNTTAGQVARVQASITSLPSRNLLCNQPCFPDSNGFAIGGVEQCLAYWKHREGFGPHALTVSWSGNVFAMSVKPNTDGWIKTTTQADLDTNASILGSFFNTITHHFNFRSSPTNLALAATHRLPPTSDSRPSPAVQTISNMSASTLNTEWANNFNAGKYLAEIAVSGTDPNLTFRGVWACRGNTPGSEGQTCSSSAKGFTSATAFGGLTTDQSVKNLAASNFANGIRLDQVKPYASGGTHAYLVNMNRSSALRGLYSSSSAAYPAQYNTLAGLGYTLHDIEYMDGDALATVWRAPHNECHLGTRLHSATDNCTAAICAADPFCCNTAWDGICVSETTSICSRSCANLKNPRGDFNEDGLTAQVLWRPSNGKWIISKGRNDPDPILGVSGDVPLHADYNGDGVADISVWRPSSQSFIVSTGQTVTSGFLSTDIPAIGDFTKDGRDDFVVWRPTVSTCTGGTNVSGCWFVVNSATLATTSRQWGTNGDIPVAGDYDNDGATDFAVFRPSSQTWWALSSSSLTAVLPGVAFGLATDIPVPCDWDADGDTDVAVYRPTLTSCEGNPSIAGCWIVRDPSTGAELYRRQWGSSTDLPLPGDYNGDGRCDMAVWRPSDHHFFLRLNLSNTSAPIANGTWLGSSTDVPVVKAAPCLTAGSSCQTFRHCCNQASTCPGTCN